MYEKSVTASNGSATALPPSESNLREQIWFRLVLVRVAALIPTADSFVSALSPLKADYFGYLRNLFFVYSD